MRSYVISVRAVGQQPIILRNAEMSDEEVDGYMASVTASFNDHKFVFLKDVQGNLFMIRTKTSTVTALSF